MKEVRIHGRGGQGAVTTGQLMAIAAHYDGSYSQTFPMFGVERAGAPVAAFCRIDRKPVRLRSEVYEPDIVIVLDSSLVQTVDVTKGLRRGGTVIINTNRTPALLGIKKGYDVHTVDATEIALRIFHRAIVNAPMLGAFSHITGLVTVKSLRRAIDEIIGRTKGPGLAELNKKAVEAVYAASK